MKAKVDAELERHQDLGIIESIELSHWAAPIVPVFKKDGSVHRCGVYKLKVNQASQLDTWCQVEDLFATLVAGKTFMKLDMSLTRTENGM